jgi:enoyl-CoA hydratase/carnithine racemase
MADIERHIEDGVCTIVLNRPDRSNAFTIEMIDQWAQWLREARTDSAIRVVLLAAEGKNFCAGADYSVLSGQVTPLERKRRLTDHIHQIAYAVDDLDKPIIAAVNGAATGAGMDMSLMCDMRIAGRSARFSESYVRVGLVPGDGGGYYLPRLVGIAKALELLLTGDFIDADEALRIGLVNRVVDDALLREESLKLARSIASLAPVNVRMIKRVTYQSARSDLRTSLDLVSSHMAVVQSTDDSREALAAFREKREPKFTGH